MVEEVIASPVTLRDFFVLEVVPRLTIAQFPPQLQATDEDGYFRFTCPKCKKPLAIMTKGHDRIVCPKEVGCGFRKGLLDVLAFPKPVLGGRYVHLVHSLAQSVGVEVPQGLPSKNPNSKKSKRPQTKKKKNKWGAAKGHAKRQMKKASLEKWGGR